MQLHCMHLLSIWSCRAFMLHLQSIHVKFHLHSKHSSAQHLRLFFFLLLFLLGVTDSVVFMLLWFAALPAIVGLAGGLCFCCCRRRCCWRCHGGSFSFCGVDALMVWCFASQCWTCWRLVFLLLLLLLLLMLFLFQCFRCRLVPMFMCCESCIHSRHCLQFEMHREHLSLFQFAVQKLSE